MIMTVRTRIAPSPTGDPHVGTAYVALFNLCFARQHGGQFILRIEDTDQSRSRPEHEASIIRALKWAGIEWDEGPDIGGDKGPYRQSERLAVYREYALKLVEKGHAFYCFRSVQEVEQLRQVRVAQGLPPGFNISNPELPEAEVQARLAAGEPYVIRMKLPENGTCVVEDLLRGSIEIDWAQIDMQVLLKSDGMPTYHLANVVDDHLMAITHVIRGEEWINSAPKHLKLYEYFGWQPPKFCHLPLLRNPDKSKLSKRKNPTSILYYQRMGYLPEALLNYLGRMGWSMPDDAEKFSLSQMIAAFDITRVSLGGPIFDVQKLNWLNARWIREDLTLEDFMRRTQQWALNSDYLRAVAGQLKDRIEIFSDLGHKAAFFFQGLPAITAEGFKTLPLDNLQLRQILQLSLWYCEGLIDWQAPRISSGLQSIAAHFQLKLKQMMPPLFLAISGSLVATPLMDAMQVLGPELTRARLRFALELLGGASKKELKAWLSIYELIFPPEVTEQE
jgi:glutamyl-tRNA synthetase